MMLLEVRTVGCQDTYSTVGISWQGRAGVLICSLHKTVGLPWYLRWAAMRWYKGNGMESVFIVPCAFLDDW